MTQVQKVRVRFFTHVIAPAGLPNFVYVPSAIGHSQVEYTALIDIDGPDTDNLKLIAKVTYHWPDAVFTFVEVGADTFHNEDLRLTKYIRGVYRLDAKHQKEPGTLRRFWAAIVGHKRVKIDQTGDAFIPTQERTYAATEYAR